MAEDIAVLGLKVVSKDIVKAQKRLDRLEKQAKKTQKEAKSLGGAFKGLGTILGIAGIGAVFKATISATIEQERAMKQLETAIKSTGGVAGFTSDQLSNMAKELQDVTTFGDETIISMQSVLLTFTKLQGEVLPRTTQAVLDLSTRMGQDLQSSAVQLGKALNDPIANLGALGRTGIQFSDEQKALIKTLVETNQLAKAQGVILDELETQFGGSAKAARDTFGGALKGLQNAFGDLLEGEGGSLDNAQSAIEELTALLQDPATKSAFAGLTTAIIEVTAAFAEGFVAVSEWSSGMGKAFSNLVSGGTSLEKINDEIKVTKENIKEAQDELKSWQWFFGDDRSEEKARLEALNAQLAEQVEWRKTLLEQSDKAEVAGAGRLAGAALEMPVNSQTDPTADTGPGRQLLLSDEDIAKIQEQDAMEAERISAGLERLRNRNKTEFEIQTEKYLNEKDLLREALDDELITRQEHAEMLIGLEEDQAARMQAINAMEVNQKLDLAKTGLSALEAVMSTGSKRQFEIAKKAALANAVINTYQAVTSGLATQPFFPVGIAMGAFALVQGLAQVKRIKAQQFGGGSATGSAAPSAAAAASAGVTPTAPQTPETQTQSGNMRPPQELNVTFQGDNIHSSAMRDFVENLAETVQDMGGVSRITVS